MKRILSLILFCALVLVSCGNANVPTDETTADTTAAVETSRYPDAVPELDFGGAVFRTIEQDSTANSFWAEEATGDVVIDAIYNRNREIEERFNVTFDETRRARYNEITTLVTSSVMSASDEFDLVFGQMFACAKNAANGLFTDWNTVPYLDFSQPWYTKSIQDASVGDKLYMIESDLSIMYTEQTWLMVYNQTKAAEYQNIPDLYQLVRDGKWTVDALNTIISGIYSDVNGNSIRDADDFYGFGANQDGCQMAAFVYGSGIRLAEVGDDLSLKHTISTERAIDAIMKLGEMMNGSEGSMRKSDNIPNAENTRTLHFCNGALLFSPLQVNDLVVGEMRDFKDSYGVLPIPKYDEAQSEYYTVVDGGANILTIPATATEEQLKMTGALVEAMSASTYQDITPIYCGLALEQKGTRDEESVEMLRMILDSRVIDFAYLYGSSGWVMKLPAMVMTPATIASQIESHMSAVDTYYKSIIEFYTAE